MTQTIDAYETARREALKEFDVLDKHDGVSRSMNMVLSNNSDPTDYDAWSKGCDSFMEDHVETFKRIGFEI